MFIKKMMTLAAVACAACSFAADASVKKYEPEEWNLKARKQFADQRFGIFIHWGFYANYAHGEWFAWDARDLETYERMMDAFYPSKYDAKEWVRVFKDAGAKYVTFTTRHHDGFSMWHTKVDDGFNIANTPFKRDVLAELAEACHAEGLQLNLYYSLMDWHRADYPAGKQSLIDQFFFPGERKPSYASYKKFMLDQIGELIDNFKPGNIWFDGEWTNYDFDWQMEDICDFIHSKKVLVANNNHRLPRDKEDIQLFERGCPGEKSDLGMKTRVAHDRPLEQCDVIQKDVWGFRIREYEFRSADNIVACLARAASRGSNLLMNVGPDASGRLPRKAIESLKGVGEWMRKNGESIYATDGCTIASSNNVVSTCRDNFIYLHFIAEDKITLPKTVQVKSAVYLETGKPAQTIREKDGTTTVKVERAKDNKFDIVVKIQTK